MKNKKILIVCMLVFFIIVTLFMKINVSQAHIEKYSTINEKFSNYGWVLYKATDDNIYLAVSERKNNRGQSANYNTAYAQICGGGVRFGLDTSIYNYIVTVVYQVDSDYNFIENCHYSYENGDYKPATNISEIIDVHLTKDITDGTGKVLYSCTDFDGEIKDPFRHPPQTMGEIMEIAQSEIIPTILMVIAVVVGLVILLIGLKKGFKILVNGLKI